MTGALHIYAPTATVRQIVTECPFCLEESDIVVWTWDYHEPKHTCLSCGFSTWRPEWKGLSPMSMGEVAENISHAELAIASGKESET